MSLLYRAIWMDSRTHLGDSARDAALRWVRGKGIDLEALPDGTVQGTVPRRGDLIGGPFELLARSAEVSGEEVVQVRLQEERSNIGERWTTTFITLCETDQPGGTLWVDIERVSADPFARVSFRAPRLVRDLIAEGCAAGGHPRVGSLELSDGPKAIRAELLAHLVLDKKRQLPLAVFSHDGEHGAPVTKMRADRAYERVAGVAQVLLLAPDQVEPFQERVGRDLAVWGGAARLYLPNRGPSGLRSERHRYVPGYKLARSPEAAGDLFAELLAATVTATPPPKGFERLRHALTRSDARELEEMLDDALAEVDRLRASIEANDEAFFELQVENEELESELNRKSGALARAFAPAKPCHSSQVVDVPDDVTTIAEAIRQAAALDHVVIHADAPRDIDKLDQAVSGRAWANGVWRALRALDAYGANDEAIEGGFWEWCRQTSSPWSWPASSKKLSMTESDSVRNNERLRSARCLPVARDVARDGLVEMFSHIKIAEGGGPMAPRIYFYDDTGGPTKKIHIGFIGPHEHMPNTRTN